MGMVLSKLKWNNFPINEDCRDYLFSFLGNEDLLVLRLVNKTIMQEVHRHLNKAEQRRVRKDYVVIDVDDEEGPRSLCQFMRVTAPVSSVFFQSAGTPKPDGKPKWENFFTQNPSILNFREEIAPGITHLKMGKDLLLGWSRHDVFQFYNSFTGLVSIELENDDVSWEPSGNVSLLPAAFQRLKVLNLTGNVPISKVFEFVRLVDECSGLVELRLTACTENENDNLQDLVDWIKTRSSLRILKLPSKTYCKCKPLGLFNILESSGVTLENIYYGVLYNEAQELKFPPYIRSFGRSYPPTCIWQEFPLLEKAWVEFLEPMALGNEGRNPQLARWTNLKALAVNFGGNNLHGLSFAFRDIVRPKLEALFFQGTEYKKNLNFLLQADIVRTCPNVTHLILQFIPFRDNFFHKLWIGLHNLQYLEIIGCSNLGDDGFIGNDPEAPLFCQLKNLRYLEIMDWYKMRRLTGTFLEKVLPKMPLRYMRLASVCMKSNFQLYDNLLSHPSDRFGLGLQWHNLYGGGIHTLNWISFSALQTLKTGVIRATIKKLDLSGLKLWDATTETLVQFSKDILTPPVPTSSHWMTFKATIALKGLDLKATFSAN